MTAGVRVSQRTHQSVIWDCGNFSPGRELVRDFKSWGGTIVRGGIEKINDQSVEVSTPIDPHSETGGGDQ